MAARSKATDADAPDAAQDDNTTENTTENTDSSGAPSAVLTEAPPKAEDVAGDPTKPLSDDGPGTAVQRATMAAAKKARQGSSVQPVAGESVVMGTDGRGVPIAASSSPNPSTSAEIQGASANAVLGLSTREGLVDHEGNDLGGSLFEDRYPASGVVYATKPVLRTQLMPQSQRATSVLVYAAGQAVPRGEAEAFQAMMDGGK